MKSRIVFCCVIILIFISSCRDELLDCAVDPKNPYLEDKELSETNVGFQYKEEILVDVTNASGDYYVYEYSLIGTLPLGLELTSQRQNNKNIMLISGMAKEQGLFEFSIEVLVTSQNVAAVQTGGSIIDDGPYKGDNLCKNVASENYTIQVN